MDWEKTRPTGGRWREGKDVIVEWKRYPVWAGSTIDTRGGPPPERVRPPNVPSLFLHEFAAPKQVFLGGEHWNQEAWTLAELKGKDCTVAARESAQD